MLLGLQVRHRRCHLLLLVLLVLLLMLLLQVQLELHVLQPCHEGLLQDRIGWCLLGRQLVHRRWLLLRYLGHIRDVGE